MGEGRYRTELCLVQVAVDANELGDPAWTELIDPFDREIDPSPIVELIDDPGVEIVVHAGRQDIALLRRLWRAHPRNCFDTQIAAAFAGMRAQIGYEALLRDLLGVDELGGTMRLGRYACELAPGSLVRKIYGRDLIHERHRHRFEFNCLYEPTLAEHGMKISGRSPDGKFVEIAELPGHPWFVAVQFHPEFQSRPLKPHPLFASFVEAAKRQQHSDTGQPVRVGKSEA